MPSPSTTNHPGPGSSTPWRMPWVLKASAGVHVAAGVAVAAMPDFWPQALAGVAANHAAVTALGLWPTSRLLGPNILRLPPAAIARREITLTFDDGPDLEITPQVLDLLDAFQVKATFFCIGVRVLQHPALAREIVQRGHRIENHSHAHRHTFSLSGFKRIEQEIRRGQAAIADTVGRAPMFFRAPAGLRNVFLDPVLHKLDLRLASWTRRGFDTARTDAGQVASSLIDDLAPGDLLLLHDGHAARTAAGTPVVIEVLPRLLQACRDRHVHPVTLDTAFS